MSPIKGMFQWAGNAPNSGRQSIRTGLVEPGTLSQLLRRSQSCCAQWTTLKNLAQSMTCCLLFVSKGHATSILRMQRQADAEKITRDPQHVGQWLGSTKYRMLRSRLITATPSFSGGSTVCAC
jgi:hypothetical protein